MLKKLLKYDLKNIYKFLIFFYVLTIFFATTTRIITLFKTTIVINIIYQISIGCLFAMIANILINTLMRSWVRFKETIYGDESYLTHTLPVTKKEIYNSKFITSITSLFTSICVIILSLLIAFYNKDNIEIIKNFLTTTSKMIDINYIVLIISAILLIYLEIYSGMQSGFIGIIIGHKKSNNKILHSVIYGLITYFASQTIILVIYFIVALFDKDIMSMFKSNSLTTGKIKYILILGIILYALIIYIGKLIASKELNKGVNVE